MLTGLGLYENEKFSGSGKGVHEFDMVFERLFDTLPDADRLIDMMELMEAFCDMLVEVLDDAGLMDCDTLWD